MINRLAQRLCRLCYLPILLGSPAVLLFYCRRTSNGTWLAWREQGDSAAWTDRLVETHETSDHRLIREFIRKRRTKPPRVRDYAPVLLVAFLLRFLIMVMLAAGLLTVWRYLHA